MTTAHGPSSPEQALPAPETPVRAQPRGQFCGRCDKPLADGEADLLDTPGSMSGARPDTWLHPIGHPDCLPYPAIGLRRGQTPRSAA